MTGVNVRFSQRLDFCRQSSRFMLDYHLAVVPFFR
jgi:hypothetical protein